MEISQFGGYRGVGKCISTRSRSASMNVNTSTSRSKSTNRSKSMNTIQEQECDLTSITGVQMYTYRDKRKPPLAGSGGKEEKRGWVEN